MGKMPFDFVPSSMNISKKSSKHPVFLTDNFHHELDLFNVVQVKSFMISQTDLAEADKHLSNKYEFLPRLFINLGFYICLIPFKVKELDISKRFFESSQHLLQKGICLVSCVTATVVCFVVAYGKIAGQNIENNPMVIFNFWSYSVFCGWCFLFTNIFFRNQSQLLALINRHRKERESKRSGSEISVGYSNVTAAAGVWRSKMASTVQGRRETRIFKEFRRFHGWKLDELLATIYFYTVVLEEIYHKTVFYLFPKKYNLIMAAEVYSGFAMQSLFVRKTTASIPYNEIDTPMMIVSIWHFIGWQIFGAIKSLIYIFVTYLALFLIGKFKSALRTLKSLDNSQEIWDLFIEMRGTVDDVNELLALPVLGIYLILVPFLSSAFIQRWDSDFVEYKILMILQFVWPMIALVLASEATRIGEKFLSRVKDKTESLQDPGLSTSKMTTAYFVFENANLGIRGGKFFTLSYGFLGTTLSVIMTYALVILGFLFENDSTRKACCASIAGKSF